MSILSKIKGAKKAASQHNASMAAGKYAPAETVEAPVPYRHVPTHAAADAISGVPSSWKEEDRSAIKAQNKRRSMMSRNNSGGSTLQRNDSYNNSVYSSSTFHGSDHESIPPLPPLQMRRSYNNNVYSSSTFHGLGNEPVPPVLPIDTTGLRGHTSSSTSLSCHEKYGYQAKIATKPDCLLIYCRAFPPPSPELASSSSPRESSMFSFLFTTFPNAEDRVRNS